MIDNKQALQIIIKKDVDIYWLKKCNNLYTYNLGLYDYRKLAKEEFKLLKEVIKTYAL